MDNWLKTRGIVLAAGYFPLLTKTDRIWRRLQKLAASGDIDMHLMYLLAIASAQKTLRLRTPIFNPTKRTPTS